MPWGDRLAESLSTQDSGDDQDSSHSVLSISTQGEFWLLWVDTRYIYQPGA